MRRWSVRIRHRAPKGYRMAVKLIATFIKPGAVFADASAAQDDRKSMFTDDLKTRMSTSYRMLKESGIIISGPDIHWDQDTCTLTITRVVTDYEDFKNFYSQVGGTVRNEISQASVGAGWQQVGFDVVPVE